MKTRAWLITVLSVVVFLAGIALANDAANTTPTPKPGEHIISASGVHSSANQTPSPVSNKSKTLQPHNTPRSSLPKSNLPVNAGQMRGVAVLGGAAAAGAHKSGVINGTEMRRSP